MQIRRSTDQEQIEIEKLIAEEDDPKIRLQLMVMNRINLSLLANTHTINDIAVKLDEHLTSYSNHVTREDALINQGRGVWKVAAWVLAIAQVIGLAVITEVRSAIQDISISQSQDKMEHVQLDFRIKVLENK